MQMPSDDTYECPEAIRSYKMRLVGGWISVKDKPSPKTGKYLCINESGDYAVVWYDSGYFKRGSWYGSCEYGCGGDDYFDNITHWMPLPEPPN